MELILKNIRAVDPVTGYDSLTDIAVDGGGVMHLGKTDDTARRVIDCTGLCAVPGLFDMHVHFRDPGFTYKEDIFTGAAAAKAGGVTGVLMMPNTDPTIDSPEIISEVLKKGAQTGINVYTAACITKGMKSRELCDFDEYARQGIFAVTDDGKPVVSAELMRRALEKAAELGITVCSHCEDLEIINGGIINKGEVSQRLGVKGMDRASEDYITAREIALAAATGAHIHICHVSTRGSVNIIRAAKGYGVNVTCETAPHYFYYTEDKLLSRDASYRMNPPLRTEDDRAAIEEAVLDGTIDCIITDHAPHTQQEKADFLTAPNGVVGLETSLAAALTHFYHSGKAEISDIARLMSSNPRKVLGLAPVTIADGKIADLCIFDPSLEWVTEPEKLHSKSKNMVFKGEKFKGKVLYTICGGRIVFEAK